MQKVWLPSKLLEELKKKYPNENLDDVINRIILEKVSPQPRPEQA